ncbi:hypothetical protein BDQ17DRAFT_1506850 [Cyathus striatus]|nr:hypothetical protein BDQ17DRAFT_1506850 [Cyathus striatus]
MPRFPWEDLGNILQKGYIANLGIKSSHVFFQCPLPIRAAPGLHKFVPWLNASPPPPPMYNLQYIFRFVLVFITPFKDVRRATEDLSQVKAVVKKFSAQHAMCLVIFRSLFTVNIHQNRTNSAAIYLGAILFTGRISMSYDGVNEEIFKVQVKIIGPYIYTLINILPGIILQLMLIYEIFAICSVFGLVLLVAAGLMGEELMPVPVVAAGMMVGEN